MGGHRWKFCPECERQWSLTLTSVDPGGGAEVKFLRHYHPATALYARPPGKKGLVRVGWLLRCGHTIIEKNLTEGLK